MRRRSRLAGKRKSGAIGYVYFRQSPNLSPDPDDDFLLAMAQVGKADFLVSGDKSGLLVFGKIGFTKIISAADFAREHLS